MSERVPEGWEVKRLDEYCVRVTDGTHNSPKRTNEGVRLVTSKNLKRGKLDFSSAYLISHTDFAEIEKRSKVDVGDVLFGMIGTIGNPVMVKDFSTPFAIKNVALFKFKGDLTKARWLQFYLDSNEFKLCVERSQTGNAQSFLGLGFLRETLLPVPPLQEQKKIASILTSVDEVIETTQKQIDKLQDLKKATMNELLTKGIGHTEFKDSELGKIPKSWEVVELGNSVKKPICYGIVQVGDFDSNGVKVIAIKYLGKINASHLHRSKKTIEEKYKRSRVISGDLLISIKGTIGRIDIVPDDFVGNISRDIARISLSSDHIPDIIQAYLESSVGKTNIAQTTVGTTRAELSIGRLVELKIPKIPLNEQVIIKQIYDSFNIEIATKFKKLSQTQSLKKSLMQDLLTGKVRVQVN